MNAPVQTWLCWAARVLSIIFALFLSVFALDVFGEHRGIAGTIVALLIHLIPTLIVLAALAIAWRSEVAGGLVFVALALGYIAMTIHRPASWSLVIAGPAILIAALFLLSAWFRSRSPGFGSAR